MKRIKNFQRNPLAHWVACALAVASVAGVAYAAPLAGEKIKNLATVSYEDENGNKYTAQSNEAVITVAEQFRATLEGDRTQSAAPGQTVYFPHTLVNTGNTPDTYTLAATGGATVYHDKDGNGEPNAGENPVTIITLAPGETVNLVVGHVIPAGAADGSSETVILTATSNATLGGTPVGIVTDIGANNDADTADEGATNEDTVNVTIGPVLVLNKKAVFDAVNNKVTYTLTVKNTGGKNAELVDILDAIPMVDHDGDEATATTPTDRVPLTGVTIDAVNGLGNAGDATATIVANTSEAVLGRDLDGDGVATDTTLMDVVTATDAVLAPNTTVSVVYSANYDPTWRAGQAIDNTFVTFSDNDEDGTPETTTTSNTTHNIIPQTYAVIAKDDGVSVPSPGVNDGHDDNAETQTDGAGDDDIQLVDEISSGDTVIFSHTIINKGNGNDIFNLDVANPVADAFPAGTVFTLWNVDGTVQLTDSDSDGIPDTGSLGQDENIVIVVKADLPAGASDADPVNPPANGYNAILTATSSADATINNPTTLKLGSIKAPAVDLAASTDGTTTATVTDGQDITGFNDAGVANAHAAGPVMLQNTTVGGTVTFPLSVANESGSADSFLLSATGVPAGWNVIFKDKNGATVTSTPFLAPGTTFEYDAVVTVSSDATQALGDAPAGVDGYVDGTGALAGTDTDKDYLIDFRVESSVDSARTDTIRHAVDVADIKAVSITPDGQNQVQPGGTVEYPHTLKNDGNIDEAVELVPTNSDPDWGSTTLIETSAGDIELSTLKNPDGTFKPVKVYNPDGSSVDVTPTDTDNDGIVEFPLEPGQYVKLINKVFAPADAPQGEVNTTTLSVTDPDGAVRNIAEDNSTVILGQVRLTKTVAVDADCDKNPDGAFAKIQATKIEPGECAVWEIFAKNEGDAKVKNVIVTDIVPTYTSLIDDSLTIDGTSKTKDIGDDEAEVSNAGVITYYLGTGTDVVNQAGGILKSGESSTVRFTVKIDE